MLGLGHAAGKKELLNSFLSDMSQAGLNFNCNLRQLFLEIGLKEDSYT